MGRKRVSNPRISFSISIDSHLLQRLNMRLGYNTSRSRWIGGAIKDKLDGEKAGEEALAQASMVEVLEELRYRATHPAFRDHFTGSFRKKLGEFVEVFENLPESGE
jgi:hypothetical protein